MNVNRNMTAAMKWRFALVLTLALLAGFSAASAFGQEKGWGHLKGQIVLAEGVDIPKMKKITPKRAEDKKFCEANKIELYVEEFVVDKESRGILGAYVMMFHGNKRRNQPELGKELPIHESYKAQLKKKVILDNNKLRFSPHSYIVVVGQELIIRNSDKVGHNVRVDGKNFFNVNAPAGSDVNVTDKIKIAERLPQPVECNMHEWMKGRILFRHEPYAAVTDKNGHFEIKNIPAGKYRFQLYKNMYLADVKDKDGKKRTNRQGIIEVEIKDGETLDLGKLSYTKKK